MLAVLFHSGTVFAAPITFNSAMPVGENDVVFRLNTTTIRASDDPSALNRDMTVQATALVGVYGWNQDVTLIGVAPYLDKEQTRSIGSSPRGDVGFGDVKGFIRYTAYRNNYRRGQTAIAPFFALEAPTGEHEKVGLPRPLQLGSGSWDPILGITFQKLGLCEGHFGAVSYQENTEADGFEFGDVYEVNYAYQNVLREYGSNESYSTLTGLFESSLVVEEKHENNGVKNPNTGGTTLYLSPGIQYVKRRWVLEGSVQLPVVQNLHGTALEKDFSITVGGRWNF